MKRAVVLSALLLAGCAYPPQATHWFTQRDGFWSTNATSVWSEPVTLLRFSCSNLARDPFWLKLYDKATAPVTGTDRVLRRYCVPGTSGGCGGKRTEPELRAARMFPDSWRELYPLRLKYGLAYATTRGRADSDTSALTPGMLNECTFWFTPELAS